MAIPRQAELAIAAVEARATAARDSARRRWDAVDDGTLGALGARDGRLVTAGRLTLNFHPDRIGAHGMTVAAALARTGRYESQWMTGVSSGSRSAIVGGDRHGFESRFFGGAYDDADPAEMPFPLYGTLDLLLDPHGGAPRFGSCYLVLEDHVRDRTTLCVGDSYTNPPDVGTSSAPWAVLAGLAEQAAHGRLLERSAGRLELAAALAGRFLSIDPSRSLDGYVEAQVHGGVDIAADVTAVVADPSFAGTSTGDDLAAVAAAAGTTVQWHRGSRLLVDDVPDHVRGPTMPALARSVARDRWVDARAIGDAARAVAAGPPQAAGDPDGHPLQQLKMLWHLVEMLGDDAIPSG